jgi:DNA invertase Pin-like site-specific DNA recombinase
MRKSIESKGWSLTKAYIDRGVSGSKSSRPQLDKLMCDASEKKFDAFLVRCASNLWVEVCVLFFWMNRLPL